MDPYNQFEKAKAQHGRNFYLLSPIIADDIAEGDYPYHTGVWLTYTEAYRREIARLQRALAHFQPVDYPWQAVAMNQWLSEFFIPVYLHFEHNKRDFRFPHYSQYGYTFPEELQYADDSEYYLESDASDVLSLAQELQDLCLSDNLFLKQIQEKLQVFQATTQLFCRRLLQHYAAEETVWPTIFEKTGLHVFNQVLTKELVHNRKYRLLTSNLVFAMVFHAFGYNQNKSNLTALPGAAYLESQSDVLDVPWCGPKTRLLFVKKAPFIVRALPLVQWMKNYLSYQRMINMIALYNPVYHDDDPLSLVKKWRQRQERDLRQRQRQERRNSTVSTMWSLVRHVLSLGLLRSSAAIADLDHNNSNKSNTADKNHDTSNTNNHPPLSTPSTASPLAITPPVTQDVAAVPDDHVNSGNNNNRPESDSGRLPAPPVTSPTTHHPSSGSGTPQPDQNNHHTNSHALSIDHPSQLQTKAAMQSHTTSHTSTPASVRRKKVAPRVILVQESSSLSVSDSPSTTALFFKEEYRREIEREEREERERSGHVSPQLRTTSFN